MFISQQNHVNRTNEKQGTYELQSDFFDLRRALEYGKGGGGDAMPLQNTIQGPLKAILDVNWKL